ncbi:tail completion protein gp17 [Rhizobium halophytocola]|uniref:DUF3168 domain-containing protein n=1 Tax=Rhizobium halophytocola TaxID=735519 RepID=A0ABS4DVH8_9HYPH|nr:DUF3168 domain-containing protein [Rhizobium halophytocola]MBP1849693.1 hypothetical protein [Rhizobium halophytocola]
MEEAVTELLLSDAGLRSLVSDNVFWGRLPQSIKAPDYCIFQLVGGGPDYVSSGRSGLEQSRLQIDGYSKQAFKCRDIANAAARVLDLHRGTVLGVRFQGGFIDTPRDFQPETAGNASALFRRSLDILLWHSS